MSQGCCWFLTLDRQGRAGKGLVLSGKDAHFFGKVLIFRRHQDAPIMTRTKNAIQHLLKVSWATGVVVRAFCVLSYLQPFRRVHRSDVIPVPGFWEVRIAPFPLLQISAPQP